MVQDRCYPLSLPSQRLLPLWTLLLSGLLWAFSIALPAPIEAQSTAEDRKVLAVLYFDNHTGDERFEHLGKGMAEMLITDLSGLPALRLVERARLQDLISEQELSRSNHSNPETALRIGRILAAEYVITGSLTASEPEFRVDSRVIHTETAEILRTASATGTRDRFFTIHEELSLAILEGLEIVLNEGEQADFERHREGNRIEDLETTVAYSQALDHYDRGNYVDALERMAFVAQRAPASAIVGMTMERIRAGASAAAAEEGRSRARDFIRRRIPPGE